MGCCQDQCPKLLECGHRCANICHTGNCSLIKDCKKKVKIACPCKRRKAEFRCGDSGDALVECDTVCREAEKMAQEQREKEEQKKFEEEMARNQKEIELFERKGEGKRRKRNRRGHLEENPSFFEKYKIYVIFSGVFCAVILAYLFVTV